MLFNKDIEGLQDDGFEGSINESHIFTEVFFGKDCDTTKKRCLVTGAINFESDYNKHRDTSLWPNSENSAITSHIESSRLKEDSLDISVPECFSEGPALFVRSDHDVTFKRIKLSVDKSSYSRPYSSDILDSSAPSKEVFSGRPPVGSQSVCQTVTCRLVESSSEGVTSSCYLLKRHVESNSGGETGSRGVSKFQLGSLDGSDVKEVNASKVIASPVSQESFATKLLVASPSVTVANKSGSWLCAEEIAKPPNLHEPSVAKISFNRDSMKDPRPLLRNHIQNLLRAAGWEVGRRKREHTTNGEYIYLNPWGGRPIREFGRAWKLCGQSLLIDENIVVQEDAKLWTDMIHFWSDLSDAIIKIEKEFNNEETTAALAYRWYLLDPFAVMVFVEKKLSTLREGKVVRARRSLMIDTSAKADSILALKNVDIKGNQYERHSTDELCDSSVVRESRLKVFEGVADCLSDQKCTCSTNTVSGTGTERQDFSGSNISKHDLSSLQACGLDDICGHSSRSLFEVPVSSGNVGCDTVSHHDRIENSSSWDRPISDQSEELALEVQKILSLGSSEYGNTSSGKVIEKSKRTTKKFKATKFSASSVADAILKRKAPKKLDKTFEIQNITLHQNDRLGPSSSYKIERAGINMNSIQLDSIGVEESCIYNSGRTDRNCGESFIFYSQHRRGKKMPRFAKFHQNHGSPKKCDQFSSDFDNIAVEVALQTNTGSLYPQAWRQNVKSGKPATKNGSRQKRSIACQLKDDDLLISAIIKNKVGRSTTKQSIRKSGAPRKHKSQKGSCRLLPRSLGKGDKHIEGKWSIFGVRTVLSWLINSRVVSLNEVIQFRNPKDDTVVKDGLVTRDGILCICCNKVLSVSEFKIHAGFRLNRPCMYLFMESGKPFTLCQLEGWSAEYKARKSAIQTVQVEEMDQNDDICGLCGDGGDLICCDNCPSTFHQECLCAQEVPEGNWYCQYCTCRICGDVVDDKEPLESPGALKCPQCEHKYHEGCLNVKGMCKEVASDTWFCSKSCQEVSIGLDSRIGFVNILSDGFSSTLLRCIHGDQRVHSAQRFVALKAECNSKLAVALTIMEECFLPMVDRRTGIDMIPHVLYNWGSQFARLNYSGFTTVVLEKDDVLMSVASIRIHGVTVAEMPLIATCSKYRRQGMCRRLMNVIEEMLISFKVEKLVLTAIPSLVETWTVGFGFQPMDEEERKSLSDVNLMVLPGTVWLKKPMYENQATDHQGSGHASPDDPTAAGGCSQGGPVIESREQCEGNSSGKEVPALHTACHNIQLNEDEDGNVVNNFLKLSCKEPASTVEIAQHKMLSPLESVLYDYRKLCSHEQLENVHVLQANAE